MPRIMRDTANEAYRNDLLQKAREKTGKNNSIIAKETGISRPTIIAIMNGDMTIRLESIQAVAKCVGLSLHDLFVKVA